MTIQTVVPNNYPAIPQSTANTLAELRAKAISQRGASFNRYTLLGQKADAQALDSGAGS